LEKRWGGGKGREIKEQNRPKYPQYTHSRDTERNDLNKNLNINNERQDCKIEQFGGGF
jgi:hypothetical protein